MKRNQAVIVAVVALVIVAGWWLMRRGGAAHAVDLIATFDSAEKRPTREMFSVVDATLNGESKRAIAVQPHAGTRLIYKIRIPENGWMRVDVGLKPEAWKQEGDGVLFMAGISDGRAFDQLFTQHVNPYSNEGDRRWITSMVDVSPYAGEEVDLIFNTFASPPGKVGDERGDLALWGEPQIVIR
jgi:hypothetical protein